MKEISRQCFASLNHEKGHHYIVLVDLNYADDIWADNHTDAVEQFRAWCRENSA